MCTTCKWCPRRPEEGIRCPAPGVTGRCDPLYMGWLVSSAKAVILTD